MPSVAVYLPHGGEGKLRTDSGHMSQGPRAPVHRKRTKRTGQSALPSVCLQHDRLYPLTRTVASVSFTDTLQLAVSKVWDFLGMSGRESGVGHCCSSAGAETHVMASSSVCVCVCLRLCVCQK